MRYIWGAYTVFLLTMVLFAQNEPQAVANTGNASTGNAISNAISNAQSNVPSSNESANPVVASTNAQKDVVVIAVLSESDRVAPLPPEPGIHTFYMNPKNATNWLTRLVGPKGIWFDLNQEVDDLDYAYRRILRDFARQEASLQTQLEAALDTDNRSEVYRIVADLLELQEKSYAARRDYGERLRRLEGAKHRRNFEMRHEWLDHLSTNDAAYQKLKAYFQ